MQIDYKHLLHILIETVETIVSIARPYMNPPVLNPLCNVTMTPSKRISGDQWSHSMTGC